MKNKLFLLLLLAFGFNVLSQTNNDTIYIYEDVEVYDTVFVYDTVWESREIHSISTVDCKKANIFDSYALNSVENYTTNKEYAAATISENSINNYETLNDDSMKNIGFIALTLAALSTFGQELSLVHYGSITKYVSYNSDGYLAAENKSSNYSPSFTIEFTTKTFKNFALCYGLGYSEVRFDLNTFPNLNNLWSHTGVSLLDEQIITETYKLKSLTIPIHVKYVANKKLDILVGFSNHIILNRKSHNSPYNPYFKEHLTWARIGLNYSILKNICLGIGYEHAFYNEDKLRYYDSFLGEETLERGQVKPLWYASVAYKIKL